LTPSPCRGQVDHPPPERVCAVNEEAQPFTDGLHDDLLTQLVKIGGLKVISRTSVLAYRDNPKALGEIAEEHLLSGARRTASSSSR
jgi:TolB-like protein